ncbi:MAG: hypothetical protein ACOXZZ_05110 [Sphaerochaetaceae bacterium]
MAKKQFTHEQRILFVRECMKWTATGKSVTTFATSIGVARVTMYDWLSRYKNQVVNQNLIQVAQANGEIVSTSGASTVGVKLTLGEISVELPSGYTPIELQEVLKIIRSLF